MTPVVEIKNLTVRFGNHLALENFSVEIPPGSFTAVVGPNGAGKSTLLKTLLGLVDPNEGTVKILGKSLREVRPSEIGYVPQFKTMDRGFPARSIELVLSGLRSRWPWRASKSDRLRALEVLRKVNVEQLAYRPLGKLSGGELQRICLARSMVHKPSFVMLDEPATGIDAVGEADLYRLLEAYQKESGASILMITHDWQAATHHASHVLLMNRRLIHFGEPRVALSEEHLRVAFGHIGHKHGISYRAADHD